MSRIVIGMSGGVDSSVAAYLLKQKGHEIVGVTMKMWDASSVGRTDDVADTQTVIADAVKVAEALSIEHHVLDVREKFKNCVIDNFVSEYLCGHTPNPCVVCNREIKWKALLDYADSIGADYIATGHYAQIIKLENGRLSVKNSVTTNKDQTYALYALSQEQLFRTIMPIGLYEKDEIRRIALLAGLPVATKKDSQDICFVPDGDYSGVIVNLSGGKLPPKGNFVDENGRILGEHNGIYNYTYGQRRGLNIACGNRIFVRSIDPQNNTVVLGEDLTKTEVICRNYNFMSTESFDVKEGLRAKVRYNHKGESGYAVNLGNGRVKFVFDKPVRAVTPGQSLVIYDGDFVFGGGIIEA